MIAHLSALVVFVGIPAPVGPLVIWLIKRQAGPFVEQASRDALNFNISVLIYLLAGGVAIVLLGVGTLGLGLLLGIPLAIAAFVAWLVLVIRAAMAASAGQAYTYPFTITFVR